MTIHGYIPMLMTIGFRKTATNMALGGDKVRHDQITRLLNKDFFSQTLLEKVTTPGNLRGGHLIIDDTTIEKPYGKDFQDASYVYSSTKDKAVFDYQLVLLVWTNGKKRIVIDYRVYKKDCVMGTVP